MKVKELIEKLSHYDQEADVCVEAWQDASVEEVKQYTYTDTNEHVVYIGDDLQYLDDEFLVNSEEEKEN